MGAQWETLQLCVVGMTVKSAGKWVISTLLLYTTQCGQWCSIQEVILTCNNSCCHFVQPRSPYGMLSKGKFLQGVGVGNGYTLAAAMCVQQTCPTEDECVT